MHLLGAAECVVTSCVFVNIYTCSCIPKQSSQVTFFGCNLTIARRALRAKAFISPTTTFLGSHDKEQYVELTVVTFSSPIRRGSFRAVAFNSEVPMPWAMHGR
jgi:hypothetical protein